MRKLENKNHHSNIPETILGLRPVDYGEVTQDLVEAFSVALQSANTEAPMQILFEAHPAALVGLVPRPHRIWVLPRVTFQNILGGGFEPDFLVCDWTSNGAEWMIVELENPTKSPINTRGISADCRHAQQQISDYRRFMKERRLELSDTGIPLSHQLSKSWIVIGRSQQHSSTDRERLVDLRNDDIEVASYDRVYEACRQMVKLRTDQRRGAEEWVASLGTQRQ
jgi:Domain of unknown function (DUF4263)